MNVTLRPAVSDDPDALGVLHVVSWRWAYAGLLPADYLAGLDPAQRSAWWRTVLAEPWPGAVLVAERAGEIIGFVTVGPCDPDEAGDPDGSGIAMLYAIYLHPDCAGLGIGHLLHEAGLAVLRDQGYTEAVLWVLRTNRRAIEFYERHGWSPDGHEQLDRSVPGVELDEIRMRRRL